jgi:hypothetical protein
MDETDDATTPVVTETEAELKEMLGLFDVPAFVRRGNELEYALGRLRGRLGRERDGMLEMVRLRLRQWASVATGPDDLAGAFAGPVAGLWALTGAGAPAWADRPAPARRRRAVARDLVASVVRFNRRWGQFLDRVSLEALNDQIERYNRYYVMEKECVLGSARLAAKHFEPRTPVTRADLLDEFPELPVPELAG